MRKEFDRLFGYDRSQLAIMQALLRGATMELCDHVGPFGASFAIM